MTSPGRTHALSITAAIANAPQDPFVIATCELGDPQHGEVLVRVHACGICHTDMAVKRQPIPNPRSQRLGHQGAGAVGLSAIIAVALSGCSTIIAVDIVPERLRMALELGATHAVSGLSDNPMAEIVELTRGGAHFSLDTTGVPALVANSINCLRA